MPGSSFGRIYQLTSFGESHGSATGGVIEGVPANFLLDVAAIQDDLDRRRPGVGDYASARSESDKIEILSGVFEGRTLGTPLSFLVRSKDARPKDYDHLKDLYRPSHADFAWEKKFGFRDHRGGGRSSARETIARVVAGSIAKQILAKKFGVQIYSYTSQIGSITAEKPDFLDRHHIESNPLRCPDLIATKEMLALLTQVKEEKDSIGGVVTSIIKHMPIGVGEPVFDKLQAILAHAMMSINAAKGFSYGLGFKSAEKKGSEQNDVFESKAGTIRTKSNFSGGIQGGISNGQDIYFDVAFKAVATIGQEQTTVTKAGEEVKYVAGGRHDVCIVPRAVPIVESMTAMVVLDMLLLQILNA